MEASLKHRACPTCWPFMTWPEMRQCDLVAPRAGLLRCASSPLLHRIEAEFGIGIGNWRSRYQRPAPTSIFLRKTIYSHCSLRSSLPLESMTSDPGTEKKDAEQQQQVEASESKPEAAVELGDPPEKPLEGDCCGQGCARCVWDVYFEELAEYKKRQELLKIQE